MAKRTGNKWLQLNEQVMSIHDVGVLGELLDEMISARQNLRHILRVHSRLNALRYRREREAISADFIKQENSDG